MQVRNVRSFGLCYSAPALPRIVRHIFEELKSFNEIVKENQIGFSLLLNLLH